MGDENDKRKNKTWNKTIRFTPSYSGICNWWRDNIDFSYILLYAIIFLLVTVVSGRFGIGNSIANEAKLMKQYNYLVYNAVHDVDGRSKMFKGME